MLLMSEANEHGILVTSRKYELATGWTAPLVLQNDTGVYGVDVQVAIGVNGDGFAVWAQYDRNIGEEGAITYIWASHYSATGWEPAQRIGNLSAGSGIQPKVSIDGSGNATAVWTQYDGNPGLPATSRSNIRSNQYRAGTGWGTDRLVSIDNSGNAYEPTVATNTEGNTIVVWRQSTLWRYGTVNLWYTTFSREKDWSQPGKVSDEIYWGGDEGYQGRITSTPVLNMDGSGDAVVLWDFENTETSNNIASSRYIAGRGWTRANLIDAPEAGYAYRPKATFDTGGRTIATWCNAVGQVDEPTVSVWANSLE